MYKRQLPANIDKDVPTIGFIAHMDTSPEMSGKDVTPRIVEKYDGSDLALIHIFIPSDSNSSNVAIE